MPHPARPGARLRCCALLAVLVGCAGPSAAGPEAATGERAAPAPQLREVFVLPDLALGAVLEQAMATRIANDRGVRLGGIGTDLWHGADDPPDEFWMLCDRGPNGLVTVDGVLRRTFLVPDYTPLLLRVRAATGGLSVRQVIPVVGASGKPVGGLSNIEGHDEVPYDATGTTRLGYSPSGLDCEGLVRIRDGGFWLVEEYGPSLVHLDASGKVRERFVPAGLDYTGADYPVHATLPAILARRKNNRGFEGLALSADQRTLFAAVQSPLLVPDQATGDDSRLARILAFDLATGKPAAEYAYRFEVGPEFDTKTPGKQADMKISGLATVDDHRLLVLERTDAIAKVFAVDLRSASDLLGTRWDDPAQKPSLEALAAPEVAGVQPLGKKLVVDLTALPDVPGKIEGIALLGASRLAFANDNDFDVGTIDAAGNNIGTGVRSRLWIVELPTPLR